MNLIQGLHGIVAVVLLCSLLFAEEAGVPLPLPGELTLIGGGILIGTGGLDPWLFVPLAYASCLAGSFTGYSWARLVGSQGLRSLAERLHQGRRLDRVAARLRQAGPREIALSRLIPGLRVYTTLVAGAVGVARNRFLAGVAPVTALWLVACVVIGVVAGVPAERILGQLQDLIVQGGVLIVLGVAGFLAIRAVPDPGREVLLRLPPRLRTVLAVLVDVGVLASVVVGVLAVVRPLTPAGDLAGWIDAIAVIAVIVVFYSVATRQGTYATAGERLFSTGYITNRDETGGWRSILRWLAASDEGSTAISHTAERFEALSDRRRLRIVHLLLLRECSAAQLVQELHLVPADLRYQLQVLQRTGLVSEVGAVHGEAVYAVAAELRGALSQILGAGWKN